METESLSYSCLTKNLIKSTISSPLWFCLSGIKLSHACWFRILTINAPRNFLNKARMTCLRSLIKPMVTLSYLKSWFTFINMASFMGKLISLIKLWLNLSMTCRSILKKITLLVRLGKRKLKFKGRCLWLQINLAKLRPKGALNSLTQLNTTSLNLKKLNWWIL